MLEYRFEIAASLNVYDRHPPIPCDQALCEREIRKNIDVNFAVGWNVSSGYRYGTSVLRDTKYSCSPDRRFSSIQEAYVKRMNVSTQQPSHVSVIVFLERFQDDDKI